MSDEDHGNSTTDSEEPEVDEKELFRQQMYEWLGMYLDNCFAKLVEQETAETDDPEEPVGE